MEESALNPNATHSQPNDPTLILLIRKLIITNSCFQVEAYVVSLLSPFSQKSYGWSQTQNLALERAVNALYIGHYN